MNKVIGTGVSRKDGRAKVTGAATYAAEHQIPGLLHGYIVTASIANGRIKSIDTRTADKAPGVIAVFTHQNAPKMFMPTNDFQISKIYEARLPLSDDRVRSPLQKETFLKGCLITGIDIKSGSKAIINLVYAALFGVISINILTNADKLIIIVLCISILQMMH